MRWRSLYFLLATIFDGTLAEWFGNGTKPNVTVTVTVSGSVLGGDCTGAALQHLAALVLTDAGVPTTAQNNDCTPKDDLKCLHTALRALTEDAAAAILTIPAGTAPAAWQLRELGIEELGDLTPPSRRACLTTQPPARSILDLQDPSIAATYHIEDNVIQRAFVTYRYTCNSANCTSSTPDWCHNGDNKCATLLTSSYSEAKVLDSIIQAKRLYASVLPIGVLLPNITRDLASLPIIACDWAPELTALADIPAKRLGPPPCFPYESCPFESRRIVKYANIRQLAHAPSAIRALVRLQLSPDAMREIAESAELKGSLEAAKEFLTNHPTRTQPGEVRVAVLLSNATERETFDGRALAAAAALFEDDLSQVRPSDMPRFKVEIYDDRCNTARAYKFLSNAPASEYQALSAIAGPACGAAWSNVAKQSPAHRMPVLAYTPQAPADVDAEKSGPETRLQILAAGDARESGNAISLLLGRMNWRRLAVLSEPATKAIADPARAHATLEVHLELPDGEHVGRDAIQDWANRSATSNLRILYVCLEDSRAIREAFCSGRKAGLTPEAGHVWLLCATPEKDWMQTDSADNCTRQQLEQIASGYITVTPEWAINWQNGGSNASKDRLDWESRWRRQCRLLTGVRDCGRPGSAAALLYDVLTMWSIALDDLIRTYRGAVDDLHNPTHVRTLISNATKSRFKGLTGDFIWTTTVDSFTRSGPVVMSQWIKETGLTTVGRYEDGNLEMVQDGIQWLTQTGRVPDDGAARCSVEGLSRALGVGCSVAWVALGALLAAMLLGALATIGVQYRRRAEKDYRERLAALGMRPLANKPIGFDKWEVPRERVVINRKLGTGAFGTVYGGHALLAPDKWTAVAVKTLKAGASTEEKLDFLSEAEAMKRFDHKNVIRLLGVVTKTEPVCTVMEFMLYGDLKGYLLARRGLAAGEAGAEGADEVSPRRLTSMALDVARALSYLAQLRYVHRDVAARNCLVSARRVVKLADFGMTRLVFENDYYRFSRKGMLPVRWMAPESLALGVFSPASDVWSFGVLLYEIVTFGSLPFQGYSNSEVLARVKGGHTLELPPGLKPQLEGLIKSCWQKDAKSRPTASEVAAFLADAPRLLAPCLDIPLDALPLDADPPWRLPRDQAEARWISWAAPGSAATDTTYLSTDGPEPLDTDSFLP